MNKQELRVARALADLIEVSRLDCVAEPAFDSSATFHCSINLVLSDRGAGQEFIKNFWQFPAEVGRMALAIARVPLRTGAGSPRTRSG
jgi:hypothetical protein